MKQIRFILHTEFILFVNHSKNNIILKPYTEENETEKSKKKCEFINQIVNLNHNTVFGIHKLLTRPWLNEN